MRPDLSSVEIVTAERSHTPVATPGHSPDGPNLAAEEGAAQQAAADYDTAVAPGEAKLWTARAALAEVPDDWAALSETHRALAAQLAALAKPLSAADPGTAVTLLSGAVNAVAAALGDAAKATDAAALHARSIARRRAEAAALAVLSDARASAMPGGIFTFG